MQSPDAPTAPAAPPPPTDNAREWSVSELSRALRRTVEDAYALVRVRGEVSGWKRHSSGHCYFTLKDADAALDAVMWKGTAAGLSFRPEDGMEVIATGRLTTYPGRSKYQIVVERMEPAGVGALLAQLEKLKARLAAEGLFAESRKRPLPALPATIGVVTSPTGAVIRDILHRLADRFPSRVILWPVAVQGPGAAAQVAAGVAGLNALPAADRPDLIIVARGGGSVEDLWAFNEEVVVRAIAASAIPTISAVGHETDTTLADFAADRRAPTPTAAAELAVPVKAELAAQLAELGARQARAIARAAAAAAERLGMTAARLPRPAALLAQPAQRLDDLAERLPRGLERAALSAAHRLEGVRARLTPALLDRQAERAAASSASLSARLGSAASARLATAARALGRAADPLRPALLAQSGRRARSALDAAARQLAILSPLATLERGYAVVERPEGGVIATAVAAAATRLLSIRFADGRIEAEPRGPAPRRPVQERLL
jgi:exodeoxyribonuclease VII large subunit